MCPHLHPNTQAVEEIYGHSPASDLTFLMVGILGPKMAGTLCAILPAIKTVENIELALAVTLPVWLLAGRSSH